MYYVYVRVHSPVYSEDDDQTTFLAQILVPNSSKSKTIRSLSKKKRKDSKGINKGLLSNGIDGIFYSSAGHLLQTWSGLIIIIMINGSVFVVPTRVKAKGERLDPSLVKIDSGNMIIDRSVL